MLLRVCGHVCVCKHVSICAWTMGWDGEASDHGHFHTDGGFWYNKLIIKYNRTANRDLPMYLLSLLLQISHLLYVFSYHVTI